MLIWNMGKPGIPQNRGVIMTVTQTIDDAVEKTVAANRKWIEEYAKEKNEDVNNLIANNFYIQLENAFKRNIYTGFTLSGNAREEVKELGHQGILEALFRHQLEMWQVYLDEHMPMYYSPEVSVMDSNYTMDDVRYLTCQNLIDGKIGILIEAMTRNPIYQKALLKSFVKERYGKQGYRNYLSKIEIKDVLGLNKAKEELDTYFGKREDIKTVEKH